MTIEICKEYAPRSRWDIGRNEVREVVKEILEGFRKEIKLSVDKDSFYVYKTYHGEHRMVCARTKKEAREIIARVHWGLDEIGAKNSIAKVASFKGDGVVTEAGEVIPLDMYLHTINISDISSF